MALLLGHQGPLRAIICAPSVPSHIADEAKQYTVIRTWMGEAVDLERKALLAGKTKDGVDIVTYAFFEPETGNPEVFIVFAGKSGGSIGAEISRSAWAELTVYRNGEPVVTFPPVAAKGLVVGYYS